MSKRKYPIGVQNFEKIRKEGYVYVDKTALIYQLVKTGSHYFLSRPRRFGKSLLLSTLEAYFLGKKELFSGLAMEHLEKEWIHYPVLHLDLNARNYEDEDALTAELNKHLEIWEHKYNSPYNDRALEERFYHVIRLATQQTGKPVVILVDEYDKPLLQSIGNADLQESFRNTLKSFYGVLKTMDASIKFGMLTGVTKFGKVSVFSDLNNLNDISMSPRYVGLCGVCEKELTSNFDEDIRQLAMMQKMGYEECLSELRERYDGYHFTYETEGIYNPFSLLCTFFNMRFGSYWFATGTPSYLVGLLKHHQYDLERMAQEETDADTLEGTDMMDSDPIPVIYQSGYLTIKDYDPEFSLYRLGFPNREVEEGFVRYLLPYYAHVSATQTPFEISRFVREVKSGDYEAFFRRLQSFFSDTPYEVIAGQHPDRDTELHYQNVLFIVFRLIGFHTKVEYHTSVGRIDLVLQTDQYIYVMEFKLNGSAEEALQQIKDKRYDLPFASDERKVIKIGINFSSATRNIDRWVVE